MNTFGLCRLCDIVQRFTNDLTIPQFRLSEHKQINNAGPDRMAKPCTDCANRGLGLTLVTDEIAYLVDAYLGAQVTDAGVARNPMGAALMMFVQVNSEH
ncbi:hypothetical protein H4S02_001576 [Coemansia sp. RSA 2611]|nr:hypothetical protein H4S02_001576 [Coemansia sp. RSA 2611]